MQFIREWLLPAHSSTETDLAINRTADREIIAYTITN